MGTVKCLCRFMAIVVMLSGCGGGGGGSSEPPPSQPPPGGSNTGSTTTSGDCSVVVSSGPFEAVWPDNNWEVRSPQSQGLCPDDLENAAGYAFYTANYSGAVLVIKNGYVVYEQYASDRDREDLVTSWSVGKSVTSMLVGLALDEELITGLDQSSADFIEEWQDTDKADISVYHMMTLRTALQTLDGTSFYNSLDQLGDSIDRDLIGTPGEILYSYSNSDVMLAGEIVRAATGMRADSYLVNRVGNTIGFSGDWWEDNEGYVMTYCCIDTTPRKFARFGLLFARDGLWKDEQLVSKSWIERSTQVALDGAYGYYWWPVGDAGFGAFGLHGQMIVVYPDIDMVVLRFSRYVRVGDGLTVRTQNRYHFTQEPQSWTNARFIELAYDSVP